MRVTKEPVCGYCRGDIAAMADKAGLKSLTIYEESTGKTLYWNPGMKSQINLNLSISKNNWEWRPVSILWNTQRKLLALVIYIRAVR